MEMRNKNLSYGILTDSHLSFIFWQLIKFGVVELAKEKSKSLFVKSSEEFRKDLDLVDFGWSNFK